MPVFDATLCGLILAVALAAVAGRDVFRAIVFFIVYGLMLAVAWVRLGALDVALAEAAISGGLTAGLFLVAYSRLAAVGARDEPAGLLNPLAALAGCGLSAALGWAWFALPQPDRPAPQLAEALPRSGVENPVTAVLLNFRAWDTLLESVVLLTALIGLLMLARVGAWPGRPGLAQHVRPGGVMAGFGRVLPPVGLLVGVYLVYVGAERPGGAFQGGTVIAAVGLVATLTGAFRPPAVDAPGWRAALVAGPLLFLLWGLAGAAIGNGFLTFPPTIAGAAILAIEAALAVSIAVTLAVLVLGAPEQATRE